MEDKQDRSKLPFALIPFEWWKGTESPEWFVAGLEVWQEQRIDELANLLFAPVDMEGAARAFGHGASKYYPNGWREVPNGVYRYINAMARHQYAMLEGEETDPESGLPHEYHRDCCAMIVGALVERSMPS